MAKVYISPEMKRILADQEARQQLSKVMELPTGEWHEVICQGVRYQVLVGNEREEIRRGVAW